MLMGEPILRKLAFGLVLLALSCPFVFSQAGASSAPDPKAVPVIDGDAGPCSADVTITDAAGAPVYAAKINVHIAYRFMSLHKLDLEVSTNVDGKARFIGIPDRLKRGLLFQASEGDRSGEAFDDPGNTCKAQLNITVRRKN